MFGPNLAYLIRIVSFVVVLLVLGTSPGSKAEAQETVPGAGDEAPAFTGQGEAADPTEEVELPPRPGVVYSPAFIDVSDDAPFASDIRSMVAAGVTRGCDPDGRHFCPEGQVTRGQMAAFLARALGLEPGAVRFLDTEHSVFAADVAALAGAGITAGCNPPDNTRFCPDDRISRGQMAAFLARALRLEPAEITFTDTLGHQFEEEISALAAVGITRGCNPPDNTRFCPDEPITRAQMAAFLLRGGVVAPAPPVPPGVSFARHPLAANLPQTRVEVCPARAPVTVIHAAHGSVIGAEAELADVTVSEGTYEFDTDVWVVPSEEPCSVLVADWLVGPPVFEMPIQGHRITSGFGVRIHPIRGVRHLHTGVDFAAPTGTSVSASAAGTVVEAGRSGLYGNSVVIAHQNGYTTRYAHLSRIQAAVGDEVVAGDLVGEVGCTGSCTGPHLHFEIRKDGAALDPLAHLNG